MARLYRFYGKVSPFHSQNRIFTTVLTILETQIVSATPFIGCILPREAARLKKKFH